MRRRWRVVYQNFQSGPERVRYSIRMTYFEARNYVCIFDDALGVRCIGLIDFFLPRRWMP